MRTLLRILLVLAAGSLLVAPARASTAPSPEFDPFYRPPAGWAQARPGTILRARPMAITSFGLLPVHVHAWQLLYRTADAFGRPSTTVTTLLRPAAEAPKGLISYQIAEDASGPQCAPSYSLRAGGGQPVSSLLNQAEILMIAAAVGQGYDVSVPDWEGPTGSLTAPNAGYMALDGIRASERFSAAGLRGTHTRTVAWGYSGGGYATAWTAQLQPTYAPEVRLVGAALGGPVTNTWHTFSALNGGVFAGFYPSVLPGLLRGNTALNHAFGSHLTPAGRRLMAEGEQQCLTTNLALHAGLNMDQALDVPFSSLMATPTVRAAFRELDPAGRPNAPLFVYQAVHDELVFEPDTTREVAGWCSRGTSVEYVRDEASEHGVLMFAGGPEALAWLSRRLEGAPSRTGCTQSTVVSTELTGTGLASVAGYFGSDLLALLGFPA